MASAGAGDVLGRSATALVTVGIAALVAAPVVAMAVVVGREGAHGIATVLGAPGLAAAVRNTFVLASVVTVVAVPVGTLMAFALRVPDLPAAPLWRLAVLVPLLVPDFVLGFSWLQAFGRAGFTDDLLGVSWDGVQGPAGVAAVVVVNAVPLAYLTVAVGLATRAEPDLERAARASGAGALTVLRTVTLPLLRPAIAAAAVLVFVLTLGTFAIPLVMGSPAGFSTITTRIYADLARSSDPAVFAEAVALALLLVLLAALIVAPADAVLAPRLRARRTAVSHGTPTAATGRAAGRWAAVGLGAYLAVTVGLPLLALVAAAVTRAVGVPPTPANWTLDHFASMPTERNVEALSRSMLLSAAAATLLVLLGACVAVLERRRASGWLATAVTLSLVVPGSALAVGLLIAYGRWLAGTLLLILLAYLSKLWAFGHRPVSGAIDRLPVEELHAARAGGAGALTAVRTVALRPLAPALFAAWLICFLTALHEVTMSTLLYGPGSETLAVVVVNAQELGRIGPSAALSVALTVLVVVPAALGWLVLHLTRAPGPADRTAVEQLFPEPHGGR